MGWSGILLGLHIVSGFTGLLTGTAALVFRKGGKRQRICAVLFYWGMIVSGWSLFILRGRYDLIGWIVFGLLISVMYKLSLGWVNFFQIGLLNQLFEHNLKFFFALLMMLMFFRFMIEMNKGISQSLISIRNRHYFFSIVLLDIAVTILAFFIFHHLYAIDLDFILIISPAFFVLVFLIGIFRKMRKWMIG